MIVVPKRKHIEVVNQLDDVRAELRVTKIDLRNMQNDRDRQKKLYLDSVKEKSDIAREYNLIKKSNEVRLDKICKMEYKIGCIEEQLSNTLIDKDKLKTLNEELEAENKTIESQMDILEGQYKYLESQIEAYRARERIKESKEIQRLEKIAKGTKKARVKIKCESRIRKIKEKEMLLEV